MVHRSSPGDWTPLTTQLLDQKVITLRRPPLPSTDVSSHSSRLAGQGFRSGDRIRRSRGCGRDSTRWRGPREFNEAIRRWAFEAYLDLEIRDPVPEVREEAALREYIGTYETIASITVVTLGQHAGLVVDDSIRPEVLHRWGEEPFDDPPYPLGMLPGEGDRFVVTEGIWKGIRGYFTRDDLGEIDGFHSSRWARRTSGGDGPARLS